MQIGIVAGAGNLPAIIATDARQRGFKIVTVALEGLASEEINKISDKVEWVNPGKLGKIIKTFKDHKVSSVILVGKVPKTLLFKSKIKPDLRAISLLRSIDIKSDDIILKAIAAEMNKDGIEIIDTASFSPHLLTPAGPLTKRTPTKEERKDIDFGWHIAKEIGRLDIGQTVVIKSQVVMAVEAIEGTDEAIIRGGRLAGEGAVVVKVSKPQQDMRLDVPVVGMETLNSLISVKAKVLALEAYRSLIINKEAFLKYASDADICVIGLKK
ncbi:MAG: UDP-2,3-diacylglucosamine diphosphatase LpxI [Thermodesulfovibrionales bacterium]|nr:UDP-2,3-diacylglucosamine diphosphatase LpxI [Thermodesulfovibrionales bacterium]